MSIEKRDGRDPKQNITDLISTKTQKQLLTLQVLNALTNIIKETKPTNFVDGTGRGVFLLTCRKHRCNRYRTSGLT